MTDLRPEVIPRITIVILTGSTVVQQLLSQSTPPTELGANISSPRPEYRSVRGGATSQAAFALGQPPAGLAAHGDPAGGGRTGEWLEGSPPPPGILGRPLLVGWAWPPSRTVDSLVTGIPSDPPVVTVFRR
ncbi:hypothetical protein DAKH74_021540 [Maudiozyma humilis]|uniref:Uncharacterized protein n=1 Tax=Maudiozyma humilis TaxID=51915 RepID=A0AAV5RW91_MAUHU|nr:hypothetical protein DAKH74_021540 [Kazachstania humilis]